MFTVKIRAVPHDTTPDAMVLCVNADVRMLKEKYEKYRIGDTS